MSLKVTKLIRLTILMGLLLSMSLLTGCGNKKKSYSGILLQAWTVKL